MTTIYQYNDGKIIFVYGRNKILKAINVVHDDINVANKVADEIIKSIDWIENKLVYPE